MDSFNQTPDQAPKRKRANKNLMWAAVVLLLLVATGVMAYLLYGAQNEKNVTQNKLNSSQKQVSDLERKVAKVSSEKTDKTKIVTDTNNSDSEAIVKAGVAYARASVGSEKQPFEVTVGKVELPFARANVGSKDGAGSMCFFKKVDDIWLPLFCAQGDSPETEKLKTQFGVPASLVES